MAKETKSKWTARCTTSLRPVAYRGTSLIFGSEVMMAPSLAAPWFGKPRPQGSLHLPRGGFKLFSLHSSACCGSSLVQPRVPTLCSLTEFVDLSRFLGLDHTLGESKGVVTCCWPILSRCFLLAHPFSIGSEYISRLKTKFGPLRSKLRMAASWTDQI